MDCVAARSRPVHVLCLRRPGAVRSHRGTATRRWRRRCAARPGLPRRSRGGARPLIRSLTMELDAFREGLLGVMERKVHWAWPLFNAGVVPADLLHIHFEQEYATYVRDFPVLVGWAYVQCPIAEVRRDLI